MVGLRPVVAPTQDDFANTLSDPDRSNLDRRARADPGRSPRKIASRNTRLRSPMAHKSTPSSQGCHLPTVNEGVQKLSGQKRIEMRY
jgi:hypothetical protein